MDGGRRLLRSLNIFKAGFGPAAFVHADLAYAGGAKASRAEWATFTPSVQPGRRSSVTPSYPARLAWRLSRRSLGLFLTFLLFGAVGLYGAVKGGEYAAFIAEHGEPRDIAAKAFGFGIEAVTISGTRELREDEILGKAGIGPRNSLLFLDVAQVRERLLSLALVKSVSVSKLFPNRLLIEIEERQPFALWQKDGQVRVVARDGTPIDWLRDDRFLGLPLVTGEGANAKIGDYLAILDAAGDLREQIRAGIYVAGRRWTLSMRNGVEVLLPEDDPKAAMAALVNLQRQSHVLDKDVLSLDFRQPGRMVAHLSAEAAAERAEMLARKSSKKKGG